jgi:hypothetical protein
VSKLTNAPFIKVVLAFSTFRTLEFHASLFIGLQVEATKFTEVGYHGRDVDSIIRDLVRVAITRCKYVCS